MKVVLFANTDWYLYNFRLSLATALRDQGADVLLVSPPGAYGSRLEDMGFRWLPAPMHRGSLNPLRELALVYWLKELLIREQVDLIHGFTIKCAIYGSLAGRMASVPARVNAVAGMGYVFTSDAWKARLLRPVVRMLLGLAFTGSNARLILQNSDDVDLFLRNGLVDRMHVRLIPGSGVDCGRFTPSLPRKSDATFRVLLPARLLWDKGLAEFVAAARSLRSSESNILFLLAGEPDQGNPAAVPEGTIRQWQNEGLVKWLGHVENMPKLFQSVDAVVLPSYREGLPKGLAEAGACGLPLITTNVPGCRDVVRHEIDGLLIPVKDADALARAILRLRNNATLCQQLGAAARARAVAVFDERIIIESTLAVYRELI